MNQRVIYIKTRIVLLAIFLNFSCSAQINPPTPIKPVPSERQLAWHEMEYYGFLHFNMNTFTNMEWGTGAESPKAFNPTELDSRQWARVAKEAGMKGLIITAKHHDGFCLWPSKYTEHSVINSLWKNGKGDVLKDLSEACKEYGLKMGVYLSPWDRNHADYGKPKYVENFHNQLKELLTNYGEIFEVWFDGANGGSGYYGGANETRKIDRTTYYQWDKAISIIRKLQPNAVIFSDKGPGVRWVGNEEGFANEKNWSIIRKKDVFTGSGKHKEMQSGHENGTHWVPAECDVSIRPGWYYHQAEDHQVKTLPHLLDIYYQSVGRNASLLLNLPVDNRGLVHENDVKQLMSLKNQLAKDFEVNLAKGQKITATNTRGNSADYAASNINDGNKKTYWATDDSIIKASIRIEFEKPTNINRILLQEYIPLGQRIKKFSIEAEIDGVWKEIDKQTTIGYKRILRFNTVKASKIKVNIIDAKASPTLSNIELFHAPNLLTEPVIKRNKEGMVSITVPDKNIDIYYTLNGETPTLSSTKYKKSFLVDNPTTIKVIAYNSEDKKQTDIIIKSFDFYKKNWKVIDNKNIIYTSQIIDDDENTDWKANKKMLNDYRIDLGKTHQIIGFTYTPTQGRWKSGIIINYAFLGSEDGKNWTQLAKGEFSNILVNPIQQRVQFKAKTKVKYIKLIADKIMNDDKDVLIAEIGIITKP